MKIQFDDDESDDDRKRLVITKQKHQTAPTPSIEAVEAVATPAQASRERRDESDAAEDKAPADLDPSSGKYWPQRCAEHHVHWFSGVKLASM